MTSPDAIQLPDIVTLKVNGKSHVCKHRVGRRMCKSKNFRVLVPLTRLDAMDGENLDELAAALRATYECVVCGSQVQHAPELGFHIEENLPPRNDWMTPGGSVFDLTSGLWSQLHSEYRFNLDVAASLANRKTRLFFDEQANALTRDWSDFSRLHALHVNRIPERELLDALGEIFSVNVRVWDNPPYNPVGEVERWLTKALEEAAKGVFSVHLVPMSTSVGWFNDLVVPYAEWHSFKGRIQFGDPLAKEGDERVSPKQDNLLVIFDPDSDVVGHTAVRDAKTGKKIWTRP